MISFCIDRLVFPMGLVRTKGIGKTREEGNEEEEEEEESDPGRARWFAYSPLHNPVAVIHHASAVVSVPVGRGDAKCSGAANTHAHTHTQRIVRYPVCVASTRAILHADGRVRGG